MKYFGVKLLLLIILICLFVGCINKQKEPLTNADDTQKSSLCCVGWQQTLNCDGHGDLDTDSDYLKTSTDGSHECNVPLISGVSGFCTCKDGTKKYFNCGELGGEGQYNNCDDVCKDNCKPKSSDNLPESVKKNMNQILGFGKWASPLPDVNTNN